MWVNCTSMVSMVENIGGSIDAGGKAGRSDAGVVPLLGGLGSDFSHFEGSVGSKFQPYPDQICTT